MDAEIEGVKVAFSSGRLTGATYDYNSAPSLASVTGRWTMTTLQGEGVALNVSSNGTFTLAATSGCTGTGTLSPRSSGKNIFNISVTFGPSPCSAPNLTATGIAVSYPLSTGQTQLIAAATDAGHNIGTAAFGVRSWPNQWQFRLDQFIHLAKNSTLISNSPFQG